MRLTEDKVKEVLRDAGVVVPEGGVAGTAEHAARIAREWRDGAVIKALIPTGRRGKSGAIRIVDTPSQVEAAARSLLGSTTNGYAVTSVYVERRIDIARELYLAFYLDDFPPNVLVSATGGVEIEEVHRTRPEAVVSHDVDPLRGLPVWDAIALWERACLDAKLLVPVSQATTRLYEVFCDSHATMLEINPLAVDAAGRLVAVGAMMATEDPLFQSGADDHETLAFGGVRSLTPGERRVIEANRGLPGGMVHYHELDGDIGMFVGGGGAGLLQHDLIVRLGGRPANHTDASTVNPEKIRVLIDTILDNPRVKSLFVSWHYQQMAQIDMRVVPVIEALRDRGIDTRTFPVVIRMFGRGEDRARRVASELPGVHYMPHGTPIEEGVRLIVRLTKEATTAEASA